ncbi:MAG: tyrosine-type recombinase/integrase [Nanoarchaeota archaeon]|nr:tyrosine-type recombinase/integrase [Nanoarchaeota archaeon]MBU1031298.1 tyrosine-type recombinase/integrase [Nanoarchaeota archaeon]MBU1849443.1 tyrosine-type recombinase/integrase [Nanoarchaeota archaeon]
MRFLDYLVMDVLEAVKREMLRRRLSRKTISTYLFYIRKFLLFCHKEPREFSKKDCRLFLEMFMGKKFSLVAKKKAINDDISGSTLNVVLNSLRFMMEEVLRKSMRLNIRYSKTPKSLPACLSRDEVRMLIDSITNQKHKMIVSLMYGSGLRVGEVVKLKKEDILLAQDIGWVRHGKGDKDRPFIIPECLKTDIESIISKINNCNYLFYGNKKTHISVRTVQVIVKITAIKVGINANIHSHTLRHSFSTHLLESGSDVTVVQSLLGHNEARTTLNYLHVAKPKLISVRSPLDSL